MYAERLHVFELLYFVGQPERQLIMYSLNLWASCSTHLVISWPMKVPEAQNFAKLYYILPHSYILNAAEK